MRNKFTILKAQTLAAATTATPATKGKQERKQESKKERKRTNEKGQERQRKIEKEGTNLAI